MGKVGSAGDIAAEMHQIGDRLRASTGEISLMAAHALAAILEEELQAKAPGTTYPTQLSVEVEESDGGALLGVVGPEPLSTWITKGTAPHPIDPVNAQALFWPGAMYPVKHVDHPGTAPNPFIDDAVQAALDSGGSSVQAALLQGVRNAIEG